jgi:hypothetical protein
MRAFRSLRWRYEANSAEMRSKGQRSSVNSPPCSPSSLLFAALENSSRSTAITTLSSTSATRSWKDTITKAGRTEFWFAINCRVIPDQSSPVMIWNRVNMDAKKSPNSSCPSSPAPAQNSSEWTRFQRGAGT